MYGISFQVPDEDIDIISMVKTPERWKNEVVEQLRHMPAVKEYTDGIYRHTNIFDFTKFGETMVNTVLSRKDNVKIITGAHVNGYDIDESTGRVKSVKTSNGETIPCSIVVNCMGP